MVPRKGIRARLGRRKEPDDRLQEATKRTKEEARAIGQMQRRAAAERRRLAQRERYLRRKEEVKVRARGAALETKRRLRPVTRPVANTSGAFLSRIAPYISRGLLFLIRIPAAFVALLLESTQAAIRWLRANFARLTTSAYEKVLAGVTPLRVFAVVGAAAAVALAVSQFFHYQAVDADNPFYEGELGGVAPAPVTHVDNAGAAHFYVLIPVALGALYLIWQAYRGNWRMGRWVAALGLAGILISLIVDLPQGLDTGLSGIAFAGAKAHLIEGFWAQLSASAVLVLCGLILSKEAREAAGEGTRGPSPARGRRRLLPRRRRSSTPDVGTVPPRWSPEQ
jgi:hypothetical protein